MVIHFAMSFFNTNLYALVAFLFRDNTVKGSEDMFLCYKGCPTQSHLLASANRVNEKVKEELFDAHPNDPPMILTIHGKRCSSVSPPPIIL